MIKAFKYDIQDLYFKFDIELSDKSHVCPSIIEIGFYMYFLI